jgi:hypothetical protein
MPTGKHDHIKSYDLNQLKKDILNNNLFGFVQVDIETPEELKEKFSEITPIFKNAEIKFEYIDECLQNYHNESDIPFNKGKKLIDSYFGKEILLYTLLLKITIKYTPGKSSQQFADEVSDARSAGDIDKAYELIAETMKLFGNCAYGKTVTNKENFVI